MANINTQNVSEAEEALQLANKDLIAFGKLFLPDDFLRSETPFFHYEMADSIDDKECKQLAVIIPRGHGKTVLTKASILKDAASGLISHALQVASFKIMDSYADKLGLDDKNIFNAPITIIDPYYEDDDNRLITTIFNPYEGAKFLEYKRKQWKKSKQK